MSNSLPRNRREMFQLWDQRVDKLESAFFAQADSNLSPVIVDRDHPELGPCFSIGFEAGIRTWCFNSQANRDRFLTYYRKVWSARACGNPRET